MYKCKYIQPIQPQLQFGVELKEIYPAWYLHPSLKNLMYLAQVNIRNQNSTRFDLDEICGKTQADGPIKQRLKLKELLSLGRNILNIKIPRGAPLWLLRHFLGLLPSPVFAPKCDPKHWLNFASDCYYKIVDCIKTRKNCNELKFTIAFELAHLEDVNLTFLFEFFDLLRFLSSRSTSSSKENIDNHAALVLAKYFASCLFQRPYTPGILKTCDKKYISVLLYIIHFWPELRVQIHDLLVLSIDKKETKFHYFPDQYKYADNNDYLKDIGVQTDLDPEGRESAMSLNFTELSEMEAINSAEQEEQKLNDELSKIEIIYDDCNMAILSPISTEKIYSSTPREEKDPPPTIVPQKPPKTKKPRKIKRIKSASSSFSSGKSKGVKVVSGKVRKSMRHSKNYEIIILELPYKVKRVKTRDIKITTLQTCSKEKRRSIRAKTKTPDNANTSTVALEKKEDSENIKVESETKISQGPPPPPAANKRKSRRNKMLQLQQNQQKSV